MPRWSLVALAIAAAVLVAMPLGWIDGRFELAARWAVTVALALGAIVAAKKNLAIWCGLCAAMAILFQPLFAVDLGSYSRWVHFAGAAAAAICVVREWE